MSVKLVAVWYLFIGMSATLTGQTNAYFSDSKVINGSIQAGTWETKKEAGCTKNKKRVDCSSLTFLKDEQGFDDQSIYAIIRNTGTDMKPQGKYEIYFNEDGNPKNGNLIKTETFDPLKEKEEVRLIFKPERSGHYMFKAYQSEGHSGTGELWGKEIKVNLKNNQKTQNEDQETEEQVKQEEIIAPEDQEEAITPETEDINSTKQQTEAKPEVNANSEESIPPTEKIDEQLEKQTKENEISKEQVPEDKSAKEENSPVAPENSDE